MPRLFAGIELPADIRLRLSLYRARLNGAHWIEPDDMHLTLRFAGDVDGRAADEFADALAGIAAASFEISLSGTGAFGGRKPAVVYADVAPCSRLDDLQRATERAARAAILDPDPRPFKPHVTLARMRGSRPETVARFLADSGGLRLGPIPVDHFVLFSARPGSGGGPYAVEEVYPLAG